MPLSLARFSWCYWSNKNDKEATISSGSASDSIKLSSFNKKQTNLSSSSSCSSSKKAKKKWSSREERKRVMDKEYDVVLVPSDGVCLSASEESSYDSDWSIGWMEPHAPGFLESDDEDVDADNNSFAVLVPCYRNDCKGFDMEEKASDDQLLNVVTSFPIGFPPEGNKYMEQWLASLQSF